VSDKVLAQLASALEMVVMEQVPQGAYVQIGDAPPPPWFDQIYRDAGQGRRPTLAQAFPAMAPFLSEAETFWKDHGSGRLESGDVQIVEASGRELSIAATAVAMNGRRFLLIQRAPAFDERQRILQRAREQALTHEGVIKAVQSLRRPLATLVRLVSDLSSTELSDRQREQLTGIRDHLGEMGRVLEDLPRAPEGAAPRKR
jgi:hypothetical protein